MDDDSFTAMRALALSVAEVVGVQPEEQALTDHLLVFQYRPNAPGVAPMSLIASQQEVIFEAGHGTRVELGSSEADRDEVLRLAAAVARGGLVEVVRHTTVRWRLEMDDGTTLKGANRRVSRFSSADRGKHVYRPHRLR